MAVRARSGIGVSPRYGVKLPQENVQLFTPLFQRRSRPILKLQIPIRLLLFFVKFDGNILELIFYKIIFNRLSSSKQSQQNFAPDIIAV